MSDADCFHCFESLENCTCGETESYSDVAPVCPYCGHKEYCGELEGTEFLEGEEIYKCSSCHKEYNLETFVLHTWTGTKRE